MAKEKIKNIHAGHRLHLKDRFLKEGLDHFQDHNILEFVLFYAIPRRDTNVIAHHLLNRFGSLSAVFDASVEDLTSIDGIGEHAAILIKSYPAVSKCYYRSRFTPGVKLKNYYDMGQELVLHFSGRENEELLALFYDNSLTACGSETIVTGNLNSLAFSFRRLADAAVYHRAAYLVLAHNHPHGTPIASSEDLNTTATLRRFLIDMNVTLIDHFIIAEGHFSSIENSNYFYIYREFVENQLELPMSEYGRNE